MFIWFLSISGAMDFFMSMLWILFNDYIYDALVFGRCSEIIGIIYRLWNEHLYIWGCYDLCLCSVIRTSQIQSNSSNYLTNWIA